MRKNYQVQSVFVKKTIAKKRKAFYQENQVRSKSKEKRNLHIYHENFFEKLKTFQQKTLM